jgi:hypothetical protein
MQIKKFHGPYTELQKRYAAARGNDGLKKEVSSVAFGDVDKRITTFADGSTRETGYNDSNLRQFRGGFDIASGGIAAAVVEGDMPRALQLQDEWNARQQLRVDLLAVVSGCIPERLEYFSVDPKSGSFTFDGYWPINGHYLVTRTNKRSINAYPPETLMVNGSTWADVVAEGLPLPYPQGGDTPALQWEAEIPSGGESCCIDDHNTFVQHLLRMGMEGKELLSLLAQA